jgi:hypothetical protein
MRLSIIFVLAWTAQNLSVVLCYICKHPQASLTNGQSLLPSTARPRIRRTVQDCHHQHSPTFRLRSTIPQWDGEISEEDQAMIQMIRGPINVGKEIRKPRSILILSDTTGVTAKGAVEKVRFRQPWVTKDAGWTDHVGSCSSRRIRLSRWFFTSATAASCT